MEGEEKTNVLRCRPGDLARIKTAWNVLLREKLVLVREAYSANEWVVRLLDHPALTIDERRTHHVITSTLIADDWALEPLRDDFSESSRGAVMGSAFPEVHQALSNSEA